MPVPAHPKIYHIVHVDRLSSIIADGCLLSDATMVARQGTGTTIGMRDIKSRRLAELQLNSHPELYVGQCAPFYFCPRSVMLYLIYMANHPNLTYRGGQEPIIHLEADLYDVIGWADANKRRWAFTLSNAGSRYFEDRCRIEDLHEINWAAISANRWQGELEDGKQAEFLIEESFPWDLVERIGVYSQAVAQRTSDIMRGAAYRPSIEIKKDWYY